jgi:hypothetical protein
MIEVVPSLEAAGLSLDGFRRRGVGAARRRGFRGGSRGGEGGSSGPYAFNTALSFDGVNDFVNVPDSVTLSPTNKWSLSLWLYWDQKLGDKTVTSKWDFTGTTGGQYFFGSSPSAGVPLRMFICSTLTDSGMNYAEIPAANILVTTWHHVVWVFDGALSGNANRLKCWVDNVQQTLTFGGTIPAAFLDISHELVLGAWTVSAARTRFWNGDLDDVWWFNTAISSDDVASLFGRTEVAGAASRWKFDEGSGTTALDSAGTNPGTISGATYVAHP